MGITMRNITAATQPLVSIIVPCYNESDAIEHFHQAICEVMRVARPIRFEVIFVDDGSKDDTLDRLTAIVDKDARFRVIELSRNFGKEAAMTAAIENARGDAIIPIDVDLQDPPEVIHELIAEWLRGADVVLARRTDRQSDTFLKRKTASMFYRLHNRISPVKIPEDVGDFRLLDRVAVDALGRLPERQRFMKGLFAWIGFKTAVVNYARQPRAAGSTKFSGLKLWNLALEGITSFSAAPLKVWTYVGGFGALMTLAYAAFIVMRVLIKGIDVPGYASLLVAVLFIGSLQLIGIGVLGEYIGRIYMESKGRPTYLVRKQHESRKAAVAQATEHPAPRPSRTIGAV
jgi:glycosyltransferase involved in cell wall biosynthesis